MNINEVLEQVDMGNPLKDFSSEESIIAELKQLVLLRGCVGRYLIHNHFESFSDLVEKYRDLDYIDHKG